MNYVVYHITSTMLEKSFPSESSAKRSTTCLNRKTMRRSSIAEYAYATEEDYRTKVVYMVTKTNMMSGKEYQEASNTPNYCYPASEAYWSM